MKYILSRKIFETKSWSPLLDLTDNIDIDLISLVESLIPSGKILEISCGNGSDSIELNKRGYDVVATENCQDYCDFVNKQIPCIKHDSREKFPFNDNSFDMVYSRLGLHYFSKEELTNIFNEISRISKYLVFTVKIQQDDLNTGKIIISKKEWEELVSNNFEILSSKIKEGVLYESESKWLEISAKKTQY